MDMKEQGRSFILYLDDLDVLMELDTEERGEVLTAIYCYKAGIELPPISKAAKVVFMTIRKALDRDAVKYAEAVAKNRTNGGRGGRPKKKKGEEETDEESEPERETDIQTKPQGGVSTARSEDREVSCQRKSEAFVGENPEQTQNNPVVTQKNPPVFSEAKSAVLETQQNPTITQKNPPVFSEAKSAVLETQQNPTITQKNMITDNCYLITDNCTPLSGGNTRARTREDAAWLERLPMAMPPAAANEVDSFLKRGAEKSLIEWAVGEAVSRSKGWEYARAILNDKLMQGIRRLEDLPARSRGKPRANPGPKRETSYDGEAFDRMGLEDPPDISALFG